MSEPTPFFTQFKSFAISKSFQSRKKIMTWVWSFTDLCWKAGQTPWLHYFFSVSCSIVSNGVPCLRWSKETGSTCLETVACSLTPAVSVAELFLLLMNSEVKSFKGGWKKSKLYLSCNVTFSFCYFAFIRKAYATNRWFIGENAPLKSRSTSLKIQDVLVIWKIWQCKGEMSTQLYSCPRA